MNLSDIVGRHHQRRRPSSELMDAELLKKPKKPCTFSPATSKYVQESDLPPITDPTPMDSLLVMPLPPSPPPTTKRSTSLQVYIDRSPSLVGSIGQPHSWPSPLHHTHRRQQHQQQQQQLPHHPDRYHRYHRHHTSYHPV